MAKEFSPAPEVQQIAERLIEILKPELEGFEIRYVMCSENPKKDGQEKTGLARKVTGFYAYLAGSPEGFFVLETGKPAYDALDEKGKIRYIHHELCHFGINEIGNLSLIPHDIEEFNEIAEIHGASDDRMILFYHALQKGESDTSTRDELINTILGRE